MTEKRARRTYSEEQKKQLVELFNRGKPRGEIIREYDLTGSAFDKWVKRINALAKEIDDTAASVHPSAWKEALAPLAEKYAAACASQKAGDPLPADA